jgi:hypothetical protein
LVIGQFGNFTATDLKLQNCPTTRLQNLEFQESIHGKHSRTNQGRTQEIKAHRPQEGESGKAQEAPRLRPRIEKAQGEEVGSRPVEAVKLAALEIRAWIVDSTTGGPCPIPL